MTGPVLLDTGPLVAFLKRKDRYHEWGAPGGGRSAAALPTCESMPSEACFLLRQERNGRTAVLELLRRGLVAVAFDLGREADAVQKLLARYGNVPMGLADACLVRLAELTAGSVLLTRLRLSHLPYARPAGDSPAHPGRAKAAAATLRFHSTADERRRDNMKTSRALLLSAVCLLVIACTSPTNHKPSDCPPPRQSDQGCPQVVVWAKDPQSGACCQYGTPCNAPEGWQTFYSEGECRSD